ncbi:MAG: type II secretion system F family protein [Planctomycetaceae bacterium]
MIPLITTGMLLVAGFMAARSIAGAWDTISRAYVADLRPMLESLALDQKHIDFLLRCWGVSLVGSFVVLGFLLGMFPIAIAAALLLLFAPRWILKLMISRRQTLLRDQLVDGTTSLANACRAGLSLAQGLETVSSEVPEPLSTELRRIVSEYQHGRSLAESINTTKERLQLDSFTLFASAVCVSLQRGGRITESLERIGRTLQENQRVERKLEAETASGRKVVLLLAIFPFVFLGGFYVMHPEGTSLVFQSLIGQFVLLIVIGLVVASVWWSNRILSIEL